MVARLSSLNFATQLDAVNRELVTTKATPRITFWGARVVQVGKGSISLDQLARRVVEASRQRCAADDLTPAERVAGLELVKKVQTFYEISDTLKKKCNFLTQFFVWLREFSLVPHTTRFYLDDSAAGNFRAFGKEKFLQQFGGAFKEYHEHNAADGSFGPPLRILAKESLIRELAPSPVG